MPDTALAGQCMEWTGSLNDDGYGERWEASTRRVRKAHRMAWEEANGPVPAGLELDHLCRNRACVNVDHLEPVTHRENVLRGNSPAAIGARATHCKRGHPFDAANTHFSPRQRVCRACDGLATLRKKARNPERFLALARARQAAFKERRRSQAA